MVTGVLPEELELDELEELELLLLLEDELLDEELLDEELLDEELLEDELLDELLDEELDDASPEFDEFPPHPAKPDKVIAIQMAIARSAEQLWSSM